MMKLQLRTPLAASLLAFAGFLAASSPSQAVTFAGSSGSLSASVDFSISGSNLVVTLTNTSTADVLNPAQILTAVFWNGLSAAITATSTAVIAPGSALVSNTPTPPTDPAPDGVGGEWAYKTGISGPGGTSNGISSTGIGVFGAGDRFPGANLQGPDSPDGGQYGITSAGDNPATPGVGELSNSALIQNSVIFTLSNIVGDLSSITNVTFLYGTAFDGPTVPGTAVPLPPALLLLGSALAGMGFLGRRRRSQTNASV